MPRSSTNQGNFLGGEWSKTAQGRLDNDAYKTALDACVNAYPVESGAWTRRPGFQDIGYTYKGAAGVIKRVTLPGNVPVIIEFTFIGGTTYARYWTLPFLWLGSQFTLLHDDTATVSYITLETPGVVTLATAVAWSTGDLVEFSIDNQLDCVTASFLVGRQWVITKIDTTHFTLSDAVTGAQLDGTKVGLDSGALTTALGHIAITTLTGINTQAKMQAINIVPAGQTVFILGDFKPQTLTFTGLPTTINVATSGDGLFFSSAVDGPFLTPYPGASQTLNSLGSVDAWGATLNFTITDGAYTFVPGDVGRLIRLWSQPPAWVAATTYTLGKNVTFNGTYWTYNSSSPFPGVYPGGSSGGATPVFPWVANPHVAFWTTGVITGFTSGTTVACSSLTHTPLNNGLIVDTWELGFYQAGFFPKNGCWTGGRLWLGGAVPNRWDAGISNGIPDPNIPAQSLGFSPTDMFGQVNPNNALALVLNSEDEVQGYWMVPIHEGILLGTSGGEFLIFASAANNIISPTSVDSRKVSNFQTANVPPANTGIATIFAQRNGRHVLEYLVDVFSQKFGARHLSVYATHLTAAGVNEVWYEEGVNPIIWVRTGSGFSGCTYRRTSAFLSTPPEFMGWHSHFHGASRGFASICVVPSAVSNPTKLPVLAAVTSDVGGKFHVEAMTPLFEETDALNTAFFVDGGITGFRTCGSDRPSLGGSHTTAITFYGFSALKGKTVSAFIAGLDCGDYVVNGDGTVVVPYGSDPDKLFTAAYIAGQSAGTYGWLSTRVDVTKLGTNTSTKCTVPVVIGVGFLSRGRLLRPVTETESRSPLGPSIGKFQRIHQFALLLVSAISDTITVTVDGGAVHTIKFLSPGGTPINHNTFFNGVYWNTIESDANLDNLFTWRVTRPVPCIVSSAACFLETQER